MPERGTGTTSTKKMTAATPTVAIVVRVIKIQHKVKARKGL